jgi:hypothetical protein
LDQHDPVGIKTQVVLTTTSPSSRRGLSKAKRCARIWAKEARNLSCDARPASAEASVRGYPRHESERLGIARGERPQVGTHNSEAARVDYRCLKLTAESGVRTNQTVFSMTEIDEPEAPAEGSNPSAQAGQEPTIAWPAYWLRIAALGIGSRDGELRVADGRISFATPDKMLFDAPISDLSDVKFPRWQGGKVFKLKVNGKRFRIALNKSGSTIRYDGGTVERSPRVLTVQAAMFCSGPVASSQV